MKGPFTSKRKPIVGTLCIDERHEWLLIKTRFGSLSSAESAELTAYEKQR